MQIAKHDLMRNTNTLSILDCIRDFGPLTKREIQEKTGLSWGAISNITGELLAKRVINEFKSNESSVGRIPSKLDISNDKNLIVGIDINIEGLTAVLIDLKCRVLKSIKTSIINNSRDEIIKQAKHVIHSLIKDSSIKSNNIIGIGVAMQGAVDVDKGISVFSPYFSDWTEVPVRQILEKEFNIPVCVEHDPNCMALTERLVGYAKDINNMLFIRLSMGIGMSIIINGEIYRGADGSAGEVGHLTMNPDGGKCSCGNYGCLEVYASGRSLLHQAREGVKLGRTYMALELTDNDNELNLGVIINAARQGDAYIKALFDDMGIYLGLGISNVINIFNPELIVLGGELTKCKDLFLDKTKDIVKQKAWKNSRVNLISSKFESDSAAIGAAAVFIQKIFAGETGIILN